MLDTFAIQFQTNTLNYASFGSSKICCINYTKLYNTLIPNYSIERQRKKKEKRNSKYIIEMKTNRGKKFHLNFYSYFREVMTWTLWMGVGRQQYVLFVSDWNSSKVKDNTAVEYKYLHNFHQTTCLNDHRGLNKIIIFRLLTNVKWRERIFEYFSFPFEKSAYLC